MDEIHKILGCFPHPSNLFGVPMLHLHPKHLTSTISLNFHKQQLLHLVAIHSILMIPIHSITE